ncbi:hypothetical protein ACJMK2_035007 [Sinanodonta woodiana]|uniref:Uncharacterized protein n=1 Tax=Sinanodonta woodiana TaxID=1069815 RepID=A0ABD3WUS5_SINWO
MADYNRVGSPMDLYEENFEESKSQIEKKKRELELKQRTRSPFLIGSIEEVNRKISNLDRKLQAYTELVVESRASDHQDVEDMFVRPSSSKGREMVARKERETREMNRFAGYYTLKQTFLPGRSERVKNISKISVQPSKTSQVTKKESGKPKFVELHQYPGYDPIELTPLPDEVPARDMMKIAADAHMQLHKKPHFKPEFEKYFYSPMSQAVFQDMFWYLFLERYQTSRNSQVKLFNRVAFNYVKLLLYVKDPQQRDVLFKDYPNLISQAIYVAYCHCFPDSYRQFGEDFKEDLVALVYGWIAGIKPAPRCWLRWNFSKLEPPNIKMREEILNQKNKKTSMVVNFDYLDSLISNNISRHASTTSLSQSASIVSAPSGGMGRSRWKGVMRKKSGGLVEQKTSRGLVPSSSSSSSHEASDSTSDTQRSNPKKLPGSTTRQKSVDPRKLIEALTPIRETTFEEDESSPQKTLVGKESQAVQNIRVMASKKGVPNVKVESHPACKGPDTTRSVFNIEGHSPLVAHFMRMKNLTRDAGQVIYVQRTEQENLPPLDAPTYHDIIQESFKKVKKAEKEHQKLYERTLKESVSFIKSQRATLREFSRKEEALLSNPKEVKRLSDLILLEMRKDPDSVSARADAAIEAALMTQT